MKKIVLIAAIVASAQASAFWGWDDSNSSTRGNYDGNADMAGDASAEIETNFTFTFTGRGRTAGDFMGNTDTDGSWAGYGYDYPYYWGGPYGSPVAPANVPPAQ
jgi:hypothetical protein